MSEKRYTVEEANALLPHLAPTLVELRERFEEASKIRELVTGIAATNGWSPSREDWSRTLARVSELIDRIQGWDITLRDIGTGLVDFPATMEGNDVWLCWRLGEPEVAYWHATDEGFDSRRPL